MNHFGLKCWRHTTRQPRATASKSSPRCGSWVPASRLWPRRWAESSADSA